MTTETPTAAAARIFNVEESEITGASRLPHIVAARQALAYVLRREHWSLKAIGVVLCGRSHTTVISAVETAERRLITDANFAVRVQALAAAIRPQQGCCCAAKIAELEKRIAELEGIQR